MGHMTQRKRRYDNYVSAHVPEPLREPVPLPLGAGVFVAIMGVLALVIGFVVFGIMGLLAMEYDLSGKTSLFGGLVVWGLVVVALLPAVIKRVFPGVEQYFEGAE